MKTMTTDELEEHLRQVRHSSEQDLDELLTDVLVQVYPTRANQDS